MITLKKEHVEKALDLLDGTLKLSDKEVRDFVYDMRVALLKGSIDGPDFAEDEINDLNDSLNYLRKKDRVEIEYYDGYGYTVIEDIFINYDVIKKELKCQKHRIRLYDLKSISILE